MKKLVILCFFVICIAMGIIFNNSLALADGEKSICEPEIRTYYFSEASNSKTGGTTTWDTYFDYDLPEGAEIVNIEVTAQHSMTQSEFMDYIELLNRPDCEVLDSGTKVCSADGKYTNYGTGYWHDISFVTDYEGYYANDVILPNSLNITFADVSNGQIKSTISRSWASPTDYIKNKIDTETNYMYTIPATAVVKIEYMADECSTPPENICEAGESSDIPGELSCSNGSYSENKNVNINMNRTIDDSNSEELDYYTKYKGDKESCTTELSEKITGLVTVSQQGNANFALNPVKQYSGGGFDFNIKYSSRASYSICDSLQYEITEWYPVYKCPAISSDINKDRYSDYTTTEETSYGDGILNGTECSYSVTTTVTNSFSYSLYMDDQEYYEEDVCEGNRITCKYASTCYCEVDSDSSRYDGDADFDHCDKESTVYNCSGGNPAYDCSNSSEEIKMLSEEMASHISYPDFSVNSEVKSRDSNDEKATGMVSMNGEWTIEHGNVSQWYPDTMITFSAWYELGKACINAKTADVRYISKDSNCDSNEEIDGGFLYYIPLKEKTGTNFPVEVYIQELSIVNIMNWQLNYKCGVDCQQKLFDLDKGGYLYYFRPISLTEPFPNRDPGVNWINWISDRKNKERLEDTYSTQNNLEYTVTLTLDDINAIKEHNANSERGYLDYSININGDSSFIQSSNVFILGNPNYSGLGVYDPEDDKQ